VVGRGKAVCQVKGREVSGRLAFYMYLGVHLFYLSGVLGDRLGVIRAWIGARFGVLENRVIEDQLPPGDQSVEEAGATTRRPTGSRRPNRGRVR
jgi:hypothetical protein